MDSSQRHILSQRHGQAEAKRRGATRRESLKGPWTPVCPGRGHDDLPHVGVSLKSSSSLRRLPANRHVSLPFVTRTICVDGPPPVRTEPGGGGHRTSSRGVPSPVGWSGVRGRVPTRDLLPPSPVSEDSQGGPGARNLLLDHNEVFLQEIFGDTPTVTDTGSPTLCGTQGSG